MKVQQLAVVFIIIILPIALLVSEYNNNNIKVLQKQAEYNDILLSSTNDAVRAFQMNTLNNGYSTVNDSKVRDISAAVNSFYNSLAVGLGTSGYKLEDLQGYIPAMLFTMYDGYYLYGNYQNMVSINSGNQVYSTANSQSLQSNNGIKPYIYYSCEYKSGSNFDIIVNYTLDNYITIMGKDRNGNIVNRSGYLINPDKIEVDDASSSITIKNDVHNTKVEPEILGEYLEVIDTTKILGVTTFSRPEVYYYNYVYYNNQKYYIDAVSPDIYLQDITSYDKDNKIKIFRLNNNLRVYLNEHEAQDFAKYLGFSSYGDIRIVQENDPIYNYKDKSAFKYYKEAQEFSKFVYELFEGLNISIVTDSYNNQLNYTTNADGTPRTIHARSTYSSNDIFKIKAPQNDPEAEDSIFNEHRMDVIISSIESNLMNIISNFNIHQNNSGYDFALPVMTEDDWYKITNNVTVATFMQGMPIGNFKYYSNYAIVANTKTKEFVSRDSILVREREIGNKDVDIGGTYHNPRCENAINDNTTELVGYNNIDYEQQVVTYDTYDASLNKTTHTLYYYPHFGAGGYECVIGKESLLFTSDNLMLGTKYHATSDTDVISSKENSMARPNVRKAYITALAREKYNLYKVNEYFEKYQNP